MPGARPPLLPLAVPAIAVVVVLALWVYPGFVTSPPGCPVVGARVFCTANLRVVQPQSCGPFYCTLSSPFTLNGADFLLRLINGSGGPAIRGSVGDSNRSYLFYVWANPLGPPWVNWTSPDGAVIVAWHAPFVTYWPDGMPGANVTCGVFSPLEIP